MKSAQNYATYCIKMFAYCGTSAEHGEFCTKSVEVYLTFQMYKSKAKSTVEFHRVDVGGTCVNFPFNP